MNDLLQGFAVAFEPSNLIFLLVGALIGMVVGVLPGLGPAATIALLLPLTYPLGPVTAVIMLAGVYYGAMYGGTITSVLLKIPGEAASVVTAIDGYQMARQGRGGVALGISAIGSFVGGTIAVVLLTFTAPFFARLASAAGPPEYAAIALLGVFLVASLGTGSKHKAMLMGLVGLLVATIGQDPVVGTERFTFSLPELLSGVEVTAIVIGLFGLSELFGTIVESRRRGTVALEPEGQIYPSRKELRESSGAIGRGSIIGFIIGLLPGGGGIISALASYATERWRAKGIGFGKGAIQGVAGPETANNASSTAAFVPLLTLGLPSNVVMGLIYGALLVQGIVPGPRLIDEDPDLFWGVVSSMYLGNVLLLILSLPLIKLFIPIVKIRLGLLAPVIAAVCMVGVYTVLIFFERIGSGVILIAIVIAACAPLLGRLSTRLRSKNGISS